MQDQKYVCPKCGGMHFSVIAHVTQEWIVDESGEFESCPQECIDVLHSPAPDDIWQCVLCGYEAEGSQMHAAS